MVVFNANNLLRYYDKCKKAHVINGEDNKPSVNRMRVCLPTL